MIIVLDTETTGLDVEEARIVEISIRLGDLDDANAEAVTRRCNPGIPIPKEASDTHGILDRDVAGCPPFAEIADFVRSCLAGALTIVGYNVQYDLDIVNAELARSGRPMIDFRRANVVDALQIWRTFEPRTLADAHRRFAGGSFSDAHSARADVEATARVVVGMLVEFGLHTKPWCQVAIVADPHAKRSSWVGPSHHFRWESDDVVFGFGKHAGDSLHAIGSSDRRFLGWLGGKSTTFPPHVKRLAAAAQKAGMSAVPLSRFIEWARSEYPPL